LQFFLRQADEFRGLFDFDLSKILLVMSSIGIDLRQKFLLGFVLFNDGYDGRFRVLVLPLIVLSH